MEEIKTERKIILADNMSPMAWDSIKGDKEAVIDRIKLMIVNGKRLNSDEVYALTVFSLANDLNPFNGEAYFLPGKGPTPGIQGFRKKSKMALRIEAKEAGVRAPFFTEEYELITDPKEAGHDPEKGDIAYRCTISDNVSQQGHADIFSDAMAKLIKAGLDVDQAYKAAEKIAGSKPVWTGIGIVYGSENFGEKEMFARHERAMKRAAKLAIKKRWPTLDLPSGMEDIDYPEPQITISEPESEEAGVDKAKHTRAEILDDLGFNNAAKKEKEKNKAVDVEFEEVQEEKPAPKKQSTNYPGSQNEYFSWVMKNGVPNIGIKDAKEILEESKGDIKMAWEKLLSLSKEKAEARKKNSKDQPELL
jgi:hypothetical protein